MNRKILQKAIDAIKGDKTDYAIGVLETLMEGLPEEIIMKNIPNNMCIVPGRIDALNSSHDEGTSIDLAAKARLNNIDTNAIKTD